MKFSKGEVDLGFYNGAVKALKARNFTALEFTNNHPKLSKKQLAKELGYGATSRGLTMRLFEEARKLDCIETTAKTLLFRKILSEYPDGWYEDEKISTSVKLGMWYSDVKEFAPEFENAAIAIIRSFTSEPPEKGWKPESHENERIRQLFKRFWKENE